MSEKKNESKTERGTRTLNSLVSENERLRKALYDCSYALFRIKRMGVADPVRAFADKHSSIACGVLDGDR